MWVRDRIFTILLKSTLCLLMAAVLHPTLRAQGFQGDSIVTIPGKPGIYRLIGHVKIVHAGNTILSNFADYEQATGSCQAYGDLRIRTRDGVRITGDVLDYNGRTGSYVVDGNVVLDDGRMTMKTPSLRFEGRDNTAHYTQGGEMVSGQTTMTSQSGYYEGKKELFHCFGNVVIVNPDYTIWTDTLHYSQTSVTQFQGSTNIETTSYYMFGRKGWFDQEGERVSLQRDAYVKNRQSQILYGDSIFYNLAMQEGEAFRNVLLLDTARGCCIRSEYARNSETDGEALFTQSPHGLMIEGDTIFVSGDTLYMTYDSARTMKEIFAYHRVKVFREDMQAVCDSLVYHHRDSIMYMYREPMLWLQDYQLDADTVMLWLSGNKPHKALARNDVFIVSEVSSSQGYYNQVKGRLMWGYFDDSAHFRTAHVHTKAQSVYYVLDDENALIGVNKTESQSLKMYFRDNEIEGVNLIKPVSSTLFRVEDLTERQRLLQGFRWKPFRRPLSKFDLSEKW